MDMFRVQVVGLVRCQPREMSAIPYSIPAEIPAGTIGPREVCILFTDRGVNPIIFVTSPAFFLFNSSIAVSKIPFVFIIEVSQRTGDVTIIVRTFRGFTSPSLNCGYEQYKQQWSSELLTFVIAPPWNFELLSRD